MRVKPKLQPRPVWALAAAAAFVFGAGAAQPAAATTAWKFRDAPNGYQATSCGVFNKTTLCAKVYCVDDGRLRVGLDGVVEARRADSKPGGVRVDRYSRPATWRVAEGSGADRRIWEAHLRDNDELIKRLKSGSVFTIAFGDRGLALDFTLNGSRAAINQVERACSHIGRGPRGGGHAAPPSFGRPGGRPGAAPRRNERQTLRQYRQEIVGRWGVNAACRAGGWTFREDFLSTPAGASCRRVQVADGPGGSVRVRGLSCTRRGAPVGPQEFEAYRNGPALLLRATASRQQTPSRLVRCAR